MNVYNFSDYVSCLKAAFNERKAILNSLTLSELAEKSKIQRTYLSHVLAGRGHLNRDQVYAVCDVLCLDDASKEYLLLLNDWERTSHPGRKQLLKKRIDAAKAVATDSEIALNRSKRDDITDAVLLYYADPLCPIVHMYLQIDKYARDLSLLRQHLKIDDIRLSEIIKILQDCRLVSVNSHGILKVVDENIHISDKHPIARNHACNFRVLAARKYQEVSAPDDYRFTATITADKATKSRIRNAFLKFLAEIKQDVEQAPAKEVFHVNFDLFDI